MNCSRCFSYSHFLLALTILLCEVFELGGCSNIIEEVLRSYYDGSHPKVRPYAGQVVMGLCPFELQHPKTFHIQLFTSDSLAEEPARKQVLQPLTLMGLSITLDKDRHELIADWFLATEEKPHSYASVEDIQKTLNLLNYSDISLFKDQQLVGSAFECWKGNSQATEKLVFVTHSCAFNVDDLDYDDETPAIPSLLVSQSHSNWKIFIESDMFSLREYVPLCAIHVTNALVDYFQSNLNQPMQHSRELKTGSREKGDGGTRYFHSLVGCSRLLSHVDRLESLWPGIMAHWIKHHIYEMSMGYISIYDSDGSAWKYVQPFVDLGYVRYHRAFLVSDSKNDDVDMDYTTVGLDPGIISKYHTKEQHILVDNHCIWESKGRSEWVILLRNPSFFLFDHVVGGMNLYGALDHIGLQHVMAHIDRMQHYIRLLSGNSSYDNLLKAYPYVEIGHPKQLISIVDPHQISTLYDMDGESTTGEIADYGIIQVYVNEYSTMFRNISFQTNLVGFGRVSERLFDNNSASSSPIIQKENIITVIDPSAQSSLELLEFDGAFFHEKILAFKDSKHTQKKSMHSSKAFESLAKGHDKTSSSKLKENKDANYRIVFVGPGLMPIPPTGWGSVENIIWNYYLELSKRGHNVTIINNPNGQEVIEEIRFINLVHTQKNKKKLDIVHVHIETLAHIVNDVIDAARLIIITIHSAFFTSPSEWQDGYNRYLDGITITARVYSHVYFFVVSPLHREWLHIYWNVPMDRIYVVPNGVEVSKFHLHLHEEETRSNGDVNNIILARNSQQQQQQHHDKSNKSVSIGVILERKGQWYLQSILPKDSIDFIGQPDIKNGTFDFTSSNYLGSWSKEDLYQNLTYYSNLVHLASAEAAAPLVVLEALAAGLGVVTTVNASINLDSSKSFITIIPDDKVRDAAFIRQMIAMNKQQSKFQRKQIRKYVEDTFSWSNAIIPKYLQIVDRLLRDCGTTYVLENNRNTAMIPFQMKESCIGNQYHWARKYSLWNQIMFPTGTSKGEEIIVERKAPYLVVLSLIENFTMVLIDWIEIMHTLGVDYFIFYTLRDHQDSLETLLYHLIYDKQLVELHYLEDFPFFQHFYQQNYEIATRTNITEQRLLRKTMFLDTAFHRQICNEAMSMLRMLQDTKWMTVLFEADFIFEDLKNYSFVTRNALQLYLKQEEQRQVDIVLIEGIVTNKQYPNLTYEENQAFIPFFASRCITSVPRTSHHGLLEVGCVSIEPCNTKRIQNKDVDNRPLYFMALEIEYLWQLKRYENVSNHNLQSYSKDEDRNRGQKKIDINVEREEITNKIKEYIESELDREAAFIIRDFVNHLPNLRRLTDVTVQRLNTVDVCQDSHILFVSFYRDIGREHWDSQYNRSSSEYLLYFAQLVETMTYPLVLYTDEPTINQLYTLLLSRESIWRRKKPDGIKVIYRNIDSVQSSAYDQYLHIHEEIMSSKAYQDLIPKTRKDKPEHNYGKYTAATNSKVDYLMAARNEFQSCSYYAFIDFGYARLPFFAPVNIDENKLIPNKIMLPSMTLPYMKHRLSRRELLASEEIFIEGSTFIIPNGMVYDYHQLWHEELARYHQEGVVDDDQSTAYQLVMQNPNLFVLVRNARWFQMYSAYLNRNAIPIVSSLN